MVIHAYQNRTAEKRAGSTQGADLFYKEVLAGFYGFGYSHFRDPVEDSLRRRVGRKRFDPDSIGRPRYNAACAAISRAVLRLARRGLVTPVFGEVSHWAGMDLTSSGEVLAERSASSRPAIGHFGMPA